MLGHWHIMDRQHFPTLTHREWLIYLHVASRAYIIGSDESREQFQLNRQKRWPTARLKESLDTSSNSTVYPYDRVQILVCSRNHVAEGRPRSTFKPNSATGDAQVSSATSVSPMSKSFYHGGGIWPLIGICPPAGRRITRGSIAKITVNRPTGTDHQSYTTVCICSEDTIQR